MSIPLTTLLPWTAQLLHILLKFPDTDATTQSHSWCIENRQLVRTSEHPVLIQKVSLRVVLWPSSEVLTKRWFLTPGVRLCWCISIRYWTVLSEAKGYILCIWMMQCPWQNVNHVTSWGTGPALEAYPAWTHMVNILICSKCREVRCHRDEAGK